MILIVFRLPSAGNAIRVPLPSQRALSGPDTIPPPPIAKPQAAIGAKSDAKWLAVGGRQESFSKHASGGKPSNLITQILPKPQCAVRT
jgi:hypothetical protein